MKFYPVKNQAPPETPLREDYRNGREIGPARLGAELLYFRAGLKTWYLPYSELRRCYRRVTLVPAKLCCGEGELTFESLVIEDGGGQLAELRMPGSRAGKALLEELKRRAPGAEFSCPPKAAEETAGEAGAGI